MTDQYQSEMEEIEVNTAVLVIGGGLSGLQTAKRVADAGYPVILMAAGDQIGGKCEPRPLSSLDQTVKDSLDKLADTIKNNKEIQVLTGARLKSFTGMPGNFTARITAESGEVEKKIGAVVVATDFAAKPLNDAYGLALSDKVIRLSQLETVLGSQEKDQLADKSVAFLFGFAGENNPLIMERVFRSVLALELIKGCTPYVYAGNLKVAGDGLERIFLESRNRGATYFKLKEKPVISPDGDSISFLDPVLRKEMELSPDLIVIEDGLAADPINADLAEKLRIDLDSAAFLQVSNVHRLPVRSNREGIFVTAGARNIQNIRSAMMDAENVVLEIKSFLGKGSITVPVNKAVLDIGKCTFCITCYRCCPHGAITWAATNKPVISAVACQGCGICASECPMDAIQIGGFNDAEILEEIKSNGKTGDQPKIVAFCCQNSAYEAGVMAKAYDMAIPSNLQIIKVPCAGKVDLDYMMNAFVEGADGVMVMACHTGNCKSEKGNIYAGWRVNDLHRMMEEIGLQKERLRFVTLASNMGGGFSDAVSEMENCLKGLK